MLAIRRVMALLSSPMAVSVGVGDCKLVLFSSLFASVSRGAPSPDLYTSGARGLKQFCAFSAER